MLRIRRPDSSHGHAVRGAWLLGIGAFTVPAALLMSCGTHGSNGGSPSPAEDAASGSPDGGSPSPDATTDDVGTGPSTDGSNGSAEGGLDAGATSSAYDGAACKRGPDAGWPTPFEAGALPDAAGLAQIVNAGVFPVLHNPTFISVTAPGDPYASELDDFLSVVGCSTYWSAVGADYGLGEGVGGTPVHLAEPPPSTMIGAWLEGKIDGADPQFPRPAPETVYVLWYPAGASAEGFDCGSGYFHSWTQLMDGTPIWYAVATRCVDDAGATDDIQALTANLSHEIVEVSTDPGNGAYAAADPGHAAEALLEGTEVADMCELQPNAYVIPTGFPWRVQRVWSNRAAWSGNDPCVPVDTPDYFYAAPILNDSVTIPVNGSPEAVSAVTIAVGSSATVDVLLVSNVTGGGPIEVTAWDEETGGTPHFTFVWEGTDGGVTTGQAGDTLHLTIKKLNGEATYQAEVFGLFTSMSGSDKQGQTFGLSAD
jgi:hypothetical protein